MNVSSDETVRAVKDYREEGYCVIRGAFSSQGLSAVEDWLARFCASARQTPTLEPEFEAGTDVVRKIRRLFWNDPAFWDPLLSSEGLLDLARSIVSPSPALVFHAAFMKPGDVGSKIAFHQDQALWSFTYPNAVNMWLAVTPSTVENGCIRVCRGSHREGIIEHAWLPDYPVHQAIDVDARGLVSEPVEMEAGDLLLWDRFMVHGSDANRTHQGRKGVVMVFVDAAQPDFRAKDQFLVLHAAAASRSVSC